MYNRYICGTLTEASAPESETDNWPDRWEKKGCCEVMDLCCDQGRAEQGGTFVGGASYLDKELRDSPDEPLLRFAKSMFAE